MSRRLSFVVLGLAAAIVVTMSVNMALGEFPISPLDVLQNLIGIGLPEHDFIVRTLRLPRALVALLVGCGLGLSGSILQGLTRNPLASPDVVGISGGAGLVAAAMLVLVPSVPLSWLPVGAFVGALIAAAATYAMGVEGRQFPAPVGSGGHWRCRCRASADDHRDHTGRDLPCQRGNALDDRNRVRAHVETPLAVLAVVGSVCAAGVSAHPAPGYAGAW